MMRSLREFELEPQTSLALRGTCPDAHDQHLIERRKHDCAVEHPLPSVGERCSRCRSFR
ncbi:hypothetical protein EMIT0373P_11816 [Pseudomonas chlororaphis]